MDRLFGWLRKPAPAPIAPTPAIAKPAQPARGDGARRDGNRGEPRRDGRGGGDRKRDGRGGGEGRGDGRNAEGRQGGDGRQREARPDGRGGDGRRNEPRGGEGAQRDGERKPRPERDGERRPRPERNEGERGPKPPQSAPRAENTARPEAEPADMTAKVATLPGDGHAPAVPAAEGDGQRRRRRRGRGRGDRPDRAERGPENENAAASVEAPVGIGEFEPASANDFRDDAAESTPVTREERQSALEFVKPPAARPSEPAAAPREERAPAWVEPAVAAPTPASAPYVPPAPLATYHEVSQHEDDADSHKPVRRRPRSGDRPAAVPALQLVETSSEVVVPVAAIEDELPKRTKPRRRRGPAAETGPLVIVETEPGADVAAKGEGLPNA
jgi:ribonuclease E